MNKSTNLIIRPEQEEELSEIYKLIQTAFATAKVKDGDEQDFAVRLRSGKCYLPELALVASLNGKLVGHSMLTTTYIQFSDNTQQKALMLAPLSVVLEHRDQGIGSALIRESFRLAKEKGYRAIFLCGDPNYYQRFGFRPSVLYGIRQEEITKDLEPYFMVHELVAGALDGIEGTINLHA